MPSLSREVPLEPLLDLEGPTAEAVIIPALFGAEPTLLYLNACADGRSLLGRPDLCRVALDYLRDTGAFYALECGDC